MFEGYKQFPPKVICTRCGENPASERLENPYGPDEIWCQSCITETENREPNYDAETEEERHQRAWQEHQDTHKRTL